MKNTPPRIHARFKERYLEIVDDWEKFEQCLLSQLPKSFRVNTLKASPAEVLEGFSGKGIKLRPVKWCPEAFECDDVRVSATVEHFTGRIYFQELVSMLPPESIRAELLESVQPRVLDAAAAPGSKTTQLAALMKNQGVIIANDSDFTRLKALKANIEKTGAVNVVATNSDFRRCESREKFNFALLDAPCSSEGTIRKNWNALTYWSEKRIFDFSRLQKQLLVRAFDLVEQNGVLVYSTCTYAPEENEGVVEFLLKERENASLEPVSFDGLKASPAVAEWKGRRFDERIGNALRVWPHHNDTGGFFLAKIRKV